jgi:hypothetical protein
VSPPRPSPSGASNDVSSILPGSARNDCTFLATRLTLLGARLWHAYARREEVTAQEARAALRRRRGDGEAVCVVARGVVFPATRKGGTLAAALSPAERSAVLRLL